MLVASSTNYCITFSALPFYLFGSFGNYTHSHTMCNLFLDVLMVSQFNRKNARYGIFYVNTLHKRSTCSIWPTLPASYLALWCSVLQSGGEIFSCHSHHCKPKCWTMRHFTFLLDKLLVKLNGMKSRLK